MQGGGVELDKCCRSKRASLELMALSKAFSFLSAFIRFSCAILLLSNSISLRSNSISLRSNSIFLISRSTTGRQLSIASQRRQRGNEERNADLLIKPDGAESRDVDMVIASEQGDQGQQEPSNKRDPARKIKSEKNHSQQHRDPNHPGTCEPFRQPGNCLVAGVRGAGTTSSSGCPWRSPWAISRATPGISGADSTPLALRLAGRKLLGIP